MREDMKNRTLDEVVTDGGATHPAGVVAILMNGSGVVMGAATDFDEGGHGGLALREAQELRAKRRLAVWVVRATCNPDIANALDGYGCDELAEKIMRRCNYWMTVIPVGHGDAP